MKRKYESCSSIGCYNQCPQKYAFKYRDHLPDPSGLEAAFGTKFHEAVYERWHSRSIEHEDPRISRMLEALWSYPSVVALPKVHLVRGVSCEKKITIDVSGTNIVGVIDIIHDEIPFPIDIKTSSKKIDSKKLQGMKQHLHYPLALKVTSFLYLLVTSPKMQRNKQPISIEEQLKWTPEVQWKKLLVTNNMLGEWEDEVAKTTLRIELDYFPTKTGPLCDWCPYQKKHCPAFN